MWLAFSCIVSMVYEWVAPLEYSIDMLREEILIYQFKQQQQQQQSKEESGGEKNPELILDLHIGNHVQKWP